MQTGALIVAAGKSSRMGDFKPMLQLGSISIAQRVINNFRQAGISKIVVVTGYRADVLERHLASNNVIFLRNEDYASTHMFDSVRIGLEYLKDKVDTVLLSFATEVPEISRSHRNGRSVFRDLLMYVIRQAFRLSPASVSLIPCSRLQRAVQLPFLAVSVQEKP